MQKILIVDDEERIRRIYRNLLTAHGFNVIAASDAMEANEALKEGSVCMALLDLKMPGVGGGTFYEVIRMFHRGVKVLVTSVYPLDDQKRIVQDADDYYDKSQGLDILLQKIKMLLRSKERK